MMSTIRFLRLCCCITKIHSATVDALIKFMLSAESRIDSNGFATTHRALPRRLT